MIFFFAFLVLGMVLFSLPAWFYGRAHGGESAWLLFLGVPAISVWLGLIGFGVGAQSMSNLVEALGLAALAVILAYVKVFLLDRVVPNAPTRPIFAFVLIIGAVLFRVFMPSLPE